MPGAPVCRPEKEGGGALGGGGAVTGVASLACVCDGRPAPVVRAGNGELTPAIEPKPPPGRIAAVAPACGSAAAGLAAVGLGRLTVEPGSSGLGPGARVASGGAIVIIVAICAGCELGIGSAGRTACPGIGPWMRCGSLPIWLENASGSRSAAISSSAD